MICFTLQMYQPTRTWALGGSRVSCKVLWCGGWPLVLWGSFPMAVGTWAPLPSPMLGTI